MLALSVYPRPECGLGVVWVWSGCGLGVVWAWVDRGVSWIEVLAISVAGFGSWTSTGLDCSKVPDFWSFCGSI